MLSFTLHNNASNWERTVTSLTIDIGKLHDPTTMILSHHTREKITVMKIIQIPLNTPYPLIVKIITETEKKLKPNITLVDNTGIGIAVSDSLPPHFVKCTTTSGNSLKFTSPTHIHTPKQTLLLSLLHKLGNKLLLIPPDLPLANLTKSEMQHFLQYTTKTNTLSANAKKKHHDDTISCLCLSSLSHDIFFGEIDSTSCIEKKLLAYK